MSYNRHIKLRIDVDGMVALRLSIPIVDDGDDDPGPPPMARPEPLDLVAEGDDDDGDDGRLGFRG